MILCYAYLYSVPKQQYFVSRATNQVYDITDRKKFCSANCFRASNFVRVQLLTSPLWLRDQEPIPEFRLMDGWRQAAAATARVSTQENDNDEAKPSLLTDDMQQLRISPQASAEELQQTLENMHIGDGNK